MNANSPLITGIAPQHVPALIAVFFLPVVFWVALRLVRWQATGRVRWVANFVSRYDAAPLSTRVTAWLLATTATVHLALPLGHEDTTMSPWFLANGAAFTALAVAVFSRRRWRHAAALILMGSIIAYLVVTGSGREEPDQVGIATKLVELAALGLVVVPSAAPVRGIRRRLSRLAASGAIVLLTVTTGMAVWLGSFAAHAQADASEAEVPLHALGEATDAHARVPTHSHGHAARAQAGTIMRPSPSRAPTPQQILAASRLAKETKAAIRRYQDYRAAIADGYAPDGALQGLEVHFTSEAYGKDGRIINPKHPETLVYAFENGRYVLLGAVFVMDRAGKPGPEIGGSITRWHAHNICLTLLPPAWTLVSPFGTCPSASVSMTLPEMIHVWIVDNPGGPYIDGLDEAVVRGLLTRKGRKVMASGKTRTLPEFGRASR